MSRGARAARGVVLVLALAGAASAALGPEVAHAADEAARAEYVRLSRELARLAERNAWSGVERTWTALQATGVPPSQADYVVAAQAAKSRGDVGGMRERLAAAAELGENREVLDWLWEIDSNYGRVELASDLGTHVLEPEVMPFAPDVAAAVRFAQASVAETGSFTGYLPAGNYSFGQFAVRVMPRVQSVRIDARGAVGPEEPRTPRRERTEPEPEPEPEPRAPRRPEPEPEPEPRRVEPVEAPPVREVRPPREPRPRPEPGVPPPPPIRQEGGSGEPVAQVVPSVGFGNLYGAQVGPGVRALARLNLGPVALGVGGGVGYDVPFGLVGAVGDGRLFFPEIALGDAAGISVWAGGGYGPLIYWFDIEGVNHLEYAPIGIAGLELRVGKVVIEGSGLVGRAVAAGVPRWWPGYGVGIGVQLP